MATGYTGSRPGYEQFSIVFARAAVLLAVMAFSQPMAETYEYEDDPVESTLIQTVFDLSALGKQAAETRRIIILSFSTEWCEYCEALDQQVLEPMILSGDFAGRALLRKIVVDDVSSIRDFDGRVKSVAQFALERKVALYPSLLFVDGRGNELAQRIVGITVLEFAADNISKALQQSLRKQDS